ncbi:MAG: twin-arginine translocation signal domain-containing protein, partial [Rhodanobacter sp.]
MKMLPAPVTDLSRRRFVQGVALGSAAVGLGLLRTSPVWALTSPGQPTVLSGTDFTLDVAEAPINITG